MTEFATSKAGHDKGQVYCIIKRSDGFVFLVNGTTRCMNHPKKKREKHVQVVSHLSKELAALCKDEKGVYFDLGIKRALRLYQKEGNNTDTPAKGETVVK